MPEDGWGWIDVTALRIADGADLLPSLTLRGARRRQSPRTAPWRGSGCRSRSRRAGASTSTSRSRRRCPRPTPGPATPATTSWSAQWFPKIAVYEPAGVRGRAAGGWNATSSTPTPSSTPTSGTTASRSRVPRRFVVGATGVRTARGGPRRRHDHPHLRAGRRARLRLDGVAALRRDHAPLRRGARRVRAGLPRRRGAARPADRGAAPRRRRGAAADAARASAAGGALPAGDDALDRGLRPGLRPLPVPDADHRRSAGGGDRHRRDGVPDLHHRRHARAVQHLAPQSRLRARDRRRPRVRAPVLPGHGRPRTSSRRRGSTRASPSGRPGGWSTTWSAPIDRSSSWPACASATSTTSASPITAAAAAR